MASRLMAFKQLFCTIVQEEEEDGDSRVYHRFEQNVESYTEHLFYIARILGIAKHY